MEFRILGPLEVWDDGRLLPLRGAKQRALLAMLLLHPNRVVSTDRLIDELWDLDSRDAGSAALRVRVHELRKLLRAGALETRAPGYLIRVGPEELDLHRFERLLEEGHRSLEAGAAGDAVRSLDEGLALWRGPALADVAYERFAQPAVARMEELRLTAQEFRMQARLALGEHVAAAGELEALVAEHPLRERLRSLLMLALYRSGRQADALHVYRQARELLSGELGLEPGGALRTLERDILRQDPRLEPGPPQATPTLPEGARSVLLAADDDGVLDRLLSVAEPIARSGGHELILARLVAEAAALGPAAARLREWREELEARGVVARPAVFTSGRPGEDLIRLAAEQDVDALIVAASEPLLDTGIPDGEVAEVLLTAVCDVAVVCGRRAGAAGPVLVPFGGADHDWAAVELGAWAARAAGAPLRLLGVEATRDGRRDASRLLSHASLALQRALGVVAEPVLVEPGEDAILAATDGAGLLVLGLSARWRHEGIGSTRLRLARGAASPVVLVRKGLRPGGLVPRASLTRYTWSVRGAPVALDTTLP